MLLWWWLLLLLLLFSRPYLFTAPPARRPAARAHLPAIRASTRAPFHRGASRRRRRRRARSFYATGLGGAGPDRPLPSDYQVRAAPSRAAFWREPPPAPASRQRCGHLLTVRLLLNLNCEKYGHGYDYEIYGNGRTAAGQRGPPSGPRTFELFRPFRAVCVSDCSRVPCSAGRGASR